MAGRRSGRIIGLFLAALPLAPASTASAAPYVVGNRSFVPTPTTDDPFVADEASLSLSRMRESSTMDSPTVRSTEMEAELEKRITPDLGISLEGGYEIDDPVRQTSSYGFQNLDGALKYQFLKSDDHEFLASLGVEREFGGTGAARVDADAVGSTTPTFYFGKGFGDLPDAMGWLKPLAITGVLGYEISDRRSLDRPDMITLGGSLQYSLRYLEGNVRYLGLPEFVDRLTPIVEVLLTTPASAAIGGSSAFIVAPGLVYSGNSFDVSAEMLIPASRGAGMNYGFILSLHHRLGGLLETVFGE